MKIHSRTTAATDVLGIGASRSLNAVSVVAAARQDELERTVRSARAAQKPSYSPTVGYYTTLRQKALAHLYPETTLRGQRRKRASGETTPTTYSDVMRAIEDKKLTQKLAHDIIAKLLDAARADLGRAGPLPEWLTQYKPARVAVDVRLPSIKPEWLSGLDATERALILHPSFDTPATSWLALVENVHNRLSFALHAAMQPGGFEAALIEPRELAPIARRIYDEVVALRASLNPVERFWLSAPQEPFEAQDRPLSALELDELSRSAPTLYRDLLAAAPIPKALPVLDELPREDAARLDDHVVLMVQHALGSLVPFVDKLVEQGASVKDMVLVPVPYSASAEVCKALMHKGLVLIDGGSRASSPHEIEEQFERGVLRALTEAVRRCERTGKQLVVVDDGGIVTRLLAGAAKYVDRSDLRASSDYRALTLDAALMPIAIVEQTARGITEAKAVTRFPNNIEITNMAHSEPKRLEGPLIAGDVIKGLSKQLETLGHRDLSGKRVAVMGFGVIGQAVAAALLERGCTVTVYDPDVTTDARVAELQRRLGVGPERLFASDDDLEAVRGQWLVVGCSGHRSVTKEALLALDAGTIVASTSSKTVEIDTSYVLGGDLPYQQSDTGSEGVVAEGGMGDHIHRALQVRLTDPIDPFKQARFVLLNSGCPVNFDGEVNCVPPELIQLTEAIKLEALKQAVIRQQVPGRGGIRDLEPERSARIIAAMDKHEPTWRKSD